MRTAKAVASNSESKGGNTAKDVEAYLAAVPEPARATLNKVRATIRSVVPAETTEGLSYGMPAFRYKGPLVAYAAFKDHCSFFPMSASLLDRFQEELKGYRTSKGTLQFSSDEPLPSTLVKRMVKARIADNDSEEDAFQVSASFLVI